MTSIKVQFKPLPESCDEGFICYRIIHRHETRSILTEHRIRTNEWDHKRSRLKQYVTPSRSTTIAGIKHHIRQDLSRIKRIDERLDSSAMPYSVDDIISEYRQYINDYRLFNFMTLLIDRLIDTGHIRTAETYRAAMHSFSRFRKGQDIMLDTIDNRLMEEYESWLRMHGLVPNTTSFYMRILRAVYNQAVDRVNFKNLYPFRHVYTGIDKTVKRALPARIVSKIKNVGLSGQPVIDFARDMFMMSFYLRGMSFIDMAYLRHNDFRNGYIYYRRSKTGQIIKIKWTEEMQQILNKYPSNKTGYLLPILRTPGINDRCAYRNMGYNINRNLKKLARIIGISIPLTMYVARHSWASIARDNGVPISVISAGMGHDSELTTRIYLSAIDTADIDRANAMIIKKL